MKKTKSGFKTHIQEPRWLQVMSVIIVVAIALFELLVVLKVF